MKRTEKYLVGTSSEKRSGDVWNIAMKADVRRDLREDVDKHEARDGLLDEAGGARLRADKRGGARHGGVVHLEGEGAACAQVESAQVGEDRAGRRGRVLLRTRRASCNGSFQQEHLI